MGKAWSMRHHRGGQIWPTMKKPGLSAKHLGKPNCAVGAGWKWIKCGQVAWRGRVTEDKIPYFTVLPRALLVQIQGICLRMSPYAKIWLARSLYPTMKKYQPIVLANSSASHGLQGMCEETSRAMSDQGSPARRGTKVQGDWPTFTNSISRKTLIIKHWIASRNEANWWPSCWVN